jgi:3'(2'), 5'-bisphosphate nucleotidase
MDGDRRNAIALELAQLASDAGRIIMGYRGGRAAIGVKADNSPVTDADKESEILIRGGLALVLPGVAMVGEESFDAKNPPNVGQRFFLVDPLDGTREFITGRDEFTVNIAYIEDGVPLAGCVYAPALHLIYTAGTSARRAELMPGGKIASLDQFRPIHTSPYPEAGLRALTSRSHGDEKTAAYLDTLNVASREACGSSLKFCKIAEGSADIYARLAPTMEWDTAAAHAVLVAAGGRVIAPDGAPLHYGKTGSGFRNSGFVAWGQEPR